MAVIHHLTGPKGGESEDGRGSCAGADPGRGARTSRDLRAPADTDGRTDGPDDDRRIRGVDGRDARAMGRRAAIRMAVTGRRLGRTVGRGGDVRRAQDVRQARLDRDERVREEDLQRERVQRGDGDHRAAGSPSRPLPRHVIGVGPRLRAGQAGRPGPLTDFVRLCVSHRPHRRSAAPAGSARRPVTAPPAGSPAAPPGSPGSDRPPPPPDGR